MEGKYKELAETLNSYVYFSTEELPRIQKEIMKQLKGVEDIEERAKFSFWHFFDYIFNDAVEKAEKGDIPLFKTSYGRLFNAIRLLEINMSDELLEEAIQHLSELDIDWLLMHHDSDRHGVITLSLMKSLMRFYRRFAEIVVSQQKQESVEEIHRRMVEKSGIIPH